MRKATLFTLIGCLAISMAWSQAADAKVKKPRKVSGTYASPAIGAAGFGGGGCAPTDGTGCVEFITKPTEHFVTISITDQSGTAVFASVSQDKETGDGVHQTVAVGDICGKTTAKLPITGGYPVDVFIWEGPGPEPPCAGIATQGTVKATFFP